MLDSFISRTRFYDITGYLLPGELFLGVVWLYIKAFWGDDCANRIVAIVCQNWMISVVILFIAVAYAVGHLANAASKILLEECFLGYEYEKRADWYLRVERGDPVYRNNVFARFKEHFGYEMSDSRSAGRIIQGWAEQELPAPSLTTFRFLCFYGMNRTFALLVLFLIPPSGYLGMRQLHCCCGTSIIIVELGVFALFIFQYLRFVELYADSLPGLLLMKR